MKLSGEAVFDVEHDEDRPFVVETFASDIRVLGTKFNVIADERHQRFSTALLPGAGANYKPARPYAKRPYPETQ